MSFVNSQQSPSAILECPLAIDKQLDICKPFSPINGRGDEDIPTRDSESWQTLANESDHCRPLGQEGYDESEETGKEFFGCGEFVPEIDNPPQDFGHSAVDFTRDRCLNAVALLGPFGCVIEIDPLPRRTVMA